MQDVVIVGAARTPIGDFGGTLKDVSPIELGVVAVNGAIAQAGIDPYMVTELGCGIILKHGHKGNPGRQIQLRCGMPVEGHAYTVDQMCSSGLKACEIATHSIMLGKTEVAVAVGTENMSQAPYLLKKARDGYHMGNGELLDAMVYDGLVCAMADCLMGVTAENLAEKYGITREEQDELALLSHQRAVAAIASGRFKEEIVPVTVMKRGRSVVVDRDEHPRDDLSLEKLAALKPAFKKGGTITAGNASSINDGAAALVLMSMEKARELGVKPLARIVSSANAGAPPEIMGIGPAYAVPKALKFAGLEKSDIGYFEINEAFAAQFLAVNRELKIDMNKINANGSGISLGHPVGCNSIRMIVSLIPELRRRNERYGLASLCAAGGPAIATIIERL